MIKQNNSHKKKVTQNMIHVIWYCINNYNKTTNFDSYKTYHDEQIKTINLVGDTEYVRQPQER